MDAGDLRKVFDFGSIACKQHGAAFDDLERPYS